MDNVIIVLFHFLTVEALMLRFDTKVLVWVKTLAIVVEIVKPGDVRIVLFLNLDITEDIAKLEVVVIKMPVFLIILTATVIP